MIALHVLLLRVYGYWRTTQTACTLDRDGPSATNSSGIGRVRVETTVEQCSEDQEQRHRRVTSAFAPSGIQGLLSGHIQEPAVVIDCLL